MNPAKVGLRGWKMWRRGVVRQSSEICLEKAVLGLLVRRLLLVRTARVGQSRTEVVHHGKLGSGQRSYSVRSRHETKSTYLCDILLKSR